MLEIKDIDAFYEEFQVLKKINLEVKQGELVTVLGPNGHGKSTLLKSICGLHKTTSGSIKFNEEEITRLKTKDIVKRGMIYIAEDRHLFPELTILENLRLGAYVKEARSNEKENLAYVFNLFPRLESLGKRLASTLSGGEARMLAIGRGLMSNGKMLAIDEPSLGLAPILREDVLQAIGGINRKGTTILLVEQNIPQDSALFKRIYLMEEGEIVFEGGLNEIIGDDRLKALFFGV